MASIRIRQAAPQEFDLLSTMNASVEIKKTMQMEQAKEEGVWVYKFREVPLPRPVTLAYPVSPKAIRGHLLENAMTLLAEEHSKPAGFLSLAVGEGNQPARVTDLVVEQAARRRGIATSLLIHAVDWLIERKIRGVVLEMMLKNYPAITLARKLGFEPSGFHDVFFPNGQTAVFFHRKIT